MGTSHTTPDIEAVLDSGTETAFLRLHLDIVIPRQRYIELATLMDQERFHEAEAMMLEIAPHAADYIGLFFGKDLRQRAADQRQAA